MSCHESKLTKEVVIRSTRRFVEVAAKVLKIRNNIVFVWINDGELMNQAIEHSKHLGFADKIRFIGFHQNGVELMADFDCLLMTSDDEGPPITVLEALSQGIPVVSTDVGGIPELLDSHGQVVSLEDSVETFTMIEGKKRLLKVIG